MRQHPASHVVRHRDHGGAAILLLTASLAIAPLAMLGVAEAGKRLHEGVRARTAADAAALAGTTGGRAAAARLASRNGARLVAYRELGDRVIVEVVVGEAHAVAAATDAP
jgi:tartrate dehydratase beta subunit/fumarate hydratase class I family protein